VSRSGDYQRALASDHWRELRRRVLADRGYACERCGMTLALLDVHHLHYRTLGDEGLDDVELLCRACHDKQHYDWGGFDDEMWHDSFDDAGWPDDEDDGER
jgi:5-methylcytosine-specific restriction endonuclease McrA